LNDHTYDQNEPKSTLVSKEVNGDITQGAMTTKETRQGTEMCQDIVDWKEEGTTGAEL
jgi:hypothetical protein